LFNLVYGRSQIDSSGSLPWIRRKSCQVNEVFHVSCVSMKNAKVVFVFWMLFRWYCCSLSRLYCICWFCLGEFEVDNVFRVKLVNALSDLSIGKNS
jgi:hypothetical protein